MELAIPVVEWIFFDRWSFWLRQWWRWSRRSQWLGLWWQFQWWPGWELHERWWRQKKIRADDWKGTWTGALQSYWAAWSSAYQVQMSRSIKMASHKKDNFVSNPKVDLIWTCILNVKWVWIIRYELLDNCLQNIFFYIQLIALILMPYVEPPPPSHQLKNECHSIIIEVTILSLTLSIWLPSIIPFRTKTSIVISLVVSSKAVIRNWIIMGCGL